jgi:hypothetical protein
MEINKVTINHGCKIQMEIKIIRICLSIPPSTCKKEIYMQIQKGCEITTGNNAEYILILHKNVYGQKQADRVWNKYLVDK